MPDTLARLRHRQRGTDGGTDGARWSRLRHRWRAPIGRHHRPRAGTAFAKHDAVRTDLAGPYDRSSIHVRLLRLFASPDYRPPVLPDVALEIVRLSQARDVSFDAVTAILERDPILAMKVLSISQSAYYAPRSPILSLRQATVRLGLKTLRDLVLEAALHLRVFRAPGFDVLMERLSRHSIVTAYVLRELCRRTAIETEYAFACGLLHDVGIAACLLALSDDSRAGPVPTRGLEAALQDVHTEASGIVVRLWGLPAEIRRVVETHHQVSVGGTPHPLNAALVVAERLAGELGAGMARAQEKESAPGLDANPPHLLDEACRALALDAHGLELARANAARVVAGMGAPPAAQVRSG